MQPSELSYIRHGVDGRPQVHVEEGIGTFGRKDAQGVPRLYVEVKDETGAVIYSTWQNGPASNWRRATLYFGHFGRDASGEEIGYSLWD